MNSKVIDKVRKLLRLAERGGTPEEAASAAAKAQELILRHKLDSVTLDDDTPEEEQVVGHHDNAPLDASGSATWKTRLAHFLCLHNSCRAVKYGRALLIVGTPTNVETVRFLYRHVSDQIQNLTRMSASGRGKSYANNYRVGCVDGVNEKLRDMQRAIRQEYAGSSALMVIDKEGKAVDAFMSGLNLRRGARSSMRPDFGARQAGRSAGRGISLNRSVGGGRRRLTG